MPNTPFYRKPRMEKLLKLLRIPGGIILRTVKEYDRDQCTARASSLAFSTLLAVVPLTAFVLSLLTAFDLQNFLVEVLLPTRQDEFKALIQQFVDNSQALGTVGLILFAITSLNLINNISRNLNALWGSRPRNNYLGKFSVYTSTLIFGTMFLAVSFTGRKFISAFLPFQGHPLWSMLLLLLPSLFMFFTFLLLIVAVPRARVKARYAATGALVGVVFWELAKAGFVSGSNYVLRASIMYGSLAVIPIFLFWLYIMWMIILGATELTYCLQYKNYPGTGETYEKLPPARRIFLGIRVYLAAASAFRNGDAPPSLFKISSRLGLSPGDAAAVASLFEEAGLLHTLGRRGDRLIPSRPLDSVTFKELIGCLLGDLPHDEPIPEPLYTLLGDIRRDMESSIKNLSVDDYLAEEIIREF